MAPAAGVADPHAASRRERLPQDVLPVYDRESVERVFREHGIKPKHVDAVYKHLASSPTAALGDLEDPAVCPSIPVKARDLLRERFTTTTTRVVGRQDGGSATKLLVELFDGQRIETVVMRHDSTLGIDPSQPDGRRRGGERATLCVSSQVGCEMGCKFCATGTMGLRADLLRHEIIEQLYHARRVEPIRNIVFMGMGEPLANYGEVRAAIGEVTNQKSFGIAPRRITVSTVGVIPGILKMAKDMPNVHLALSLHAPTQGLRQDIVPSAGAAGLTRLMGAVKRYQDQTGNRVFIEYVMLHGVNDGETEAHELGLLLQDHGVEAVINLIPWNPVLADPGIVFEAPGVEHLERFQKILGGVYGVRTTIRVEKGQDISGACGQLVVADEAKGGGGGGGGRDIEDLVRGVGAGAETACGCS
ncbi:unnamed protein product [Pedinophyceae sp. YPF-701]|nr:unnamed protein product [Pedinophyceae sp. YPF-701]